MVDWESLPKLDINITESADYITAKSSELIVAINKNNKQIQYFHPDSSVWLKETGNPEFQHQENMMNYRGQEVVLSQSNVNAISPVLVSTQNYGIFWDNYSLTKFNNQNQSIMQLWSEMGDCIEFYFTAGNNADQVIANYRQLTRVEPLLPRWAFGYWQSKERYKTQQETKNIAQRFRKLGKVGAWQMELNGI